MKKLKLLAGIAILSCMACQQNNKTNSQNETDQPKESWQLLGYESKEAYGEHLVTIGGCDDCHSPKIMGPQGPEINKDLRLSGHPAEESAPAVDRKEVESKFIAVFNPGLTACIGPWGISYSSNITSDETGIGNWTEENFIRCLREGKFKGLADARNLLPPMPYPSIGQMTDEELSAVFAFLKSTKPVRNIVPEPTPPLAAMNP